MAISVAPQEETSRKHREALALHQTRMVEAELELQEIEVALPTADVDEADDLLRRKRELLDKSEWLNARTAELARKADAEIVRERMIMANQQWSPLAEERRELIAQLDAMVDSMLPILAGLDANSESQGEVLASLRSLEAMRGRSDDSQCRSANSMLRVSIANRLGLLRGYEDHASFLPRHSDSQYGQDAATAAKLFSVPKEM